MIDYKNLLSRINTRYNPENNHSVESRMFASLPSGIEDIQRYVYLSMMAVDENYTSKTKEAGQKVKTHLQGEGLSDVSYHYQGSVMTDTHIIGYSDIDLLVVCEKFYSYDSSNIKRIIQTSDNRYSDSQMLKLRHVNDASPYNGNANDDLRIIRRQSEIILSNNYLICDINHPKAIKITNQNLHRKVDVVVAGWYDDVNSIINNQEITYRGIQVYDKTENLRCGKDFPFLSIERINTKSANTGGRLKRMIRFLKNVKADSELEINLSSFDINAICYNIEVGMYDDLYYMDLLKVVYLQLCKIVNDELYANRMMSVDGNEYIFRNNSKRQEVLKMLHCVYAIYSKFYE